MGSDAALYGTVLEGPQKTFSLIRHVAADEVKSIKRAHAILNKAISGTPHHELLRRTEGLTSARASLVANSTESLEIRRGRFAAALNEIVEHLRAYGDRWDEWLDELAEGDADVASAKLVEAKQRFHADPLVLKLLSLTGVASESIKIVGAQQDPQVVIAVGPEPAILVDGLLQQVLLRDMPVIHEYFNAAKPVIDAASKLVLSIFSECLLGDPILGPADPSAHHANWSITAIQPGWAKSAQLLMLRVRQAAKQVESEAKGSGPAAGSVDVQAAQETIMSPSQPAPTEQGGEPNGAEEVTQDPLSEIPIDLSSVVESLLGREDSLRQKWSDHYPHEEFFQAAAEEREFFMSFAVASEQVLKQCHRTFEDAGVDVDLPNFPPTASDLAEWSMTTPQAQWRQLAIGFLIASQVMADAMARLDHPVTLQIAHGVVENLVFDPAAVAALSGSARQLRAVSAELEKGAYVIAPTGNFPVTVGSVDSIEELRIAFRSAYALGLPEAALIYATRILAIQESDHPEVEQILDNARGLLAAFVGGSDAARGSMLGLAHGMFALARDFSDAD
jgi:hypothetical protein